MSRRISVNEHLAAQAEIYGIDLDDAGEDDFLGPLVEPREVRKSSEVERLLDVLDELATENGGQP